jgi:excisionase family DNA binding protein
MESDSLLLTELQAAKRLNLSSKTLSKIRKRGEIHFVKVGRAIRYDVEAIVAWIMRTRTVAST